MSCKETAGTTEGEGLKGGERSLTRGEAGMGVYFGGAIENRIDGLSLENDDLIFLKKILWLILVLGKYRKTWETWF